MSARQPRTTIVVPVRGPQYDPAEMDQIPNPSRTGLPTAWLTSAGANGVPIPEINGVVPAHSLDTSRASHPPAAHER